MTTRRSAYGMIYWSIIIVTCTLIAYYCKQQPRTEQEIEEQKESAISLLRTFDPNTIDYEQMWDMQFNNHLIASIARRQQRQWYFEVPEDMLTLYGMNDSIFRIIRPYIKIAEKFKKHPFQRDTTARRAYRNHIVRCNQHFSLDTVSYDFLYKLGFYSTEAKNFIRNIELRGVPKDMDEFRDMVATNIADSLAPWIVFPPRDPHEGMVNINKADSAKLQTVVGIGAKSAAAIVNYRRLLGGYYSIEQIKEIKIITQENFERISKQIFTDSCVNSKIDINFATASAMERHPYLTEGTIKKIITLRKTKGGWKSLKEMNEDKIFTERQAQLIAPYLRFGELPENFNIPKTDSAVVLDTIKQSR